MEEYGNNETLVSTRNRSRSRQWRKIGNLFGVALWTVVCLYCISICMFVGRAHLQGYSGYVTVSNKPLNYICYVACTATKD